MFQWNENHAAIATGGRKMGNWCSRKISTDTREIKKGDLFIALKGRNFDGHNFLDEAFAKGAIAAIVSKPLSKPIYSDNRCKNFPLIIVEDTLKALHNMASYYIKNVLVGTKVIAVTGSVGKTTTKDMLHTTLSQYGVSHANNDNLNNNIGLPLTILAAPQNCEYLILEMGMSKSGEIKELSEISNPDIAIITNVEHAHTANFSSLFDIARAKLEVLHGMKSNGILVLNKDNQYYDYLSSQSARNRSNTIDFGRNPDAMIHLLDLTRSHNGLILKVKLSNSKIINCHLHVQGEHFVYSALATIAVMEILKLELPQNAFATFKLPSGRGNIYSTQYKEKHIWLIDDSYNASPASMKAAIRTLGTHSNKRKVALLGDMLELGDESIKFHRELCDFITEYNIDRVHTVGGLMSELHKLLPDEIKGMHFNDSHQLKNNLNDIIQNNDVVLIKGSRRVKMDLIVQKILSA